MLEGCRTTVRVEGDAEGIIEKPKKKIYLMNKRKREKKTVCK